MHRSRLCALVIDSKVSDLDEGANFWARALNKKVQAPSSDSPNYRDLIPDDEVLIMVQKVDHDSRVHLDIETDDVEAEVKRLEALGAKRVEKIRTWWVMQAPSGQRFCVVVPQRGKLGPNANVWE